MIDFVPHHRAATEQELEFIFHTQITNCALLKGTEVQYFTCVDSHGNVTKKVVIEYDETRSNPTSNQ